MAFRSLVTVNNKSSEPELEGNIRSMVRASASARKAVEGEDDQMSAGDLGALLRDVSKVSMDEVDRLITELQTLQQTLKTTAERIERDIADYETLSAQATQMTKIVCDGMKQLPTRA